jgi:N-acetylmuramoyl-L-alanine amidase
VVLSIAPLKAQDTLEILNMRFGEHSNKTRIVFDISRETDFLVHNAKQEKVIWVDFPSFEWRAGKDIRIAGLVKAARTMTPQKGLSRVRVDLHDWGIIQSAFLIPPREGKAARLVIDLKKATKEEVSRRAEIKHGTFVYEGEEKEEPAGITATDKTALDNTFAKIAQKQPKIDVKSLRERPESEGQAQNEYKSFSKPYVVMIDPGHGGIDSGAVSGDIFEKDITFSMSKTLKDILEQTGRYEVHLTRNDDIYLKLYQRVALARYKEADLFISIHADSINQANVKGASIYTLSDQASDEQTQRLAERENKSDLISGLDLDIQDQDVAGILIDLSMRETMNQAKYFASRVVDAFDGQNIKLLKNPHRFAGFAVLKAPDVPSVLVEVGFLSNPSEARKLMQPQHQQKIGRALLSSIDSYFTTIEENKRSQ